MSSLSLPHCGSVPFVFLDRVSHLGMKFFLEECFSYPPNQVITSPVFPALWGIYNQYLLGGLINIGIFSREKGSWPFPCTAQVSAMSPTLEMVRGCVTHPLNGEEGARQLTALMSESRTLTANAVPHAKGCVRYSSVSGSSSSSWSKNWTLVSFTRKGIK